MLTHPRSTRCARLTLQTTQQYRIMAIDHALVSFTDATLSRWPQIVVTNPKDAQFQSPNEPLGLMLRFVARPCAERGRLRGSWV